MSIENPTTPETPAEAEARSTSDARIFANRLNALKSTGPRTVEGKARSRANAYKHGFCAAVIDVPGEDGEALVNREAGWQAELNPLDREVQGYIVHLAVRQTGRLDRLNTVYGSKVARLARNAQKSLKAKRMRLVEKLSRLLMDDCDTAVRRLKLIPEGCQYLIIEFEKMRTTLVPPAQFDAFDEVVLVRLMGLLSASRQKAPSPVGFATNAITKHRDMAFKLEQNKYPDRLMWDKRYNNEVDHQYDLDSIDFLASDAERCRLWLGKRIDQNTAELRALKTELEAEDALRLDEHSRESRFDATDEGKLLHRYEIDTQRTLFRCLKEVQTLNLLAADEPQPVNTKTDRITEEPRPSWATAATRARNEPNDVPRSASYTAASETSGPAFSFVPMNITVAPTPKNRK